MRIALVTDTYAPSVNGVASFTANLAGQLAAEGHEVAILAPKVRGSAPGEWESSVEEVRFRSVPLPLYSNARLCIVPRSGKGVDRFIKEFRPDVIHAQTHFFLARKVLKSAQRLGIPVLATCHSNSEN